MPEGPSIVILKEAVQQFAGKKIISVGGNTKIDKDRMLGQTVADFKSWGKHFLICFNNFSLRIHFMLFGSYRINEQKETIPRLTLRFRKGELNFYSCALELIDLPLNKVYDWSADVMNDQWDPRKARKKLRARPDDLVCDALLDQQIFAGVGNIIKNEVLFRVSIHPESKVGKLPSKQLNAIIREARKYSFEFMEWKKKFELKKHWLAYNKKECPRDHVLFIRKNLGRTNRRSFFCNECQKLFK